MERTLLVIFLALITISAVFIALSINAPSGEHELIINFSDGTTSNSQGLDISCQNKTIDSVTYRVNKPYNLADYNPYFDTPMGDHQIELTNGECTVPIYKLVNYTVDNDVYTITLIPDGEVTHEGESIILSQLSFSVHVFDDRHVNIIVQ